MSVYFQSIVRVGLVLGLAATAACTASVEPEELSPVGLEPTAIAPPPEDTDPNVPPPEVTDPGAQSVPGNPATCAEVRAADASAGDGYYWLYYANQASMPWIAYCDDMAGQPAEYLWLPAGGAYNFSQYTAKGFSSGTSVRTSYDRIRIDPLSFAVDVSDQKFSTSTGQLQHGGDMVTSMPYAVAMECAGGTSGLANIDLRGTPFAVVQGLFEPHGFIANGYASYWHDDQFVILHGGGYCGWLSPAPYYNPYNKAGGYDLYLSYASP